MTPPKDVKRGKMAFLSLFICLAICFPSPDADADMINWIGATGYWDDPLNWDLERQPQDGDDVNPTPSDDTDRTIVYQNTLYPAAMLNTLRLNSTGSGTITFSQTADTLAVDSEYMGVDGGGSAVFDQSGGNHQVGYFEIGAFFGGTGSTYNLSGTGTLPADQELMGAPSTRPAVIIPSMIASVSTMAEAIT